MSCLILTESMETPAVQIRRGAAIPRWSMAAMCCFALLMAIPNPRAVVAADEEADTKFELKPARSVFDMRDLRAFISQDLSRTYSRGSLANWGIETRKVHGRVIDHEGKPVVGAQVAIAEPIGYSGNCYDENFDTTDELGRFVLEGHIRRNRLAIRRGPGQIWRAELKPDQRSVEVTWPQPAKLTLAVDPKLCQPKSQLSISTAQYWAGMSTMNYSAQLDGEYRAAVQDVMPGDYVVSTKKMISIGGKEKSRYVEIGRFSVNAGESKVVRCEPVGQAMIQGKLKGALYVTIDRQKNTYHDVARTVDIVALREDGGFQVGPLSAGRYVLRFFGASGPEIRGGRFGGPAGDQLARKQRIAIHKTDMQVELNLSTAPKGVVAFVHQTLDSERSRGASWSHADVQAAQLSLHVDRAGVVKELLRALDDPNSPQPWQHVILQALGSMTETPGVLDGLLASIEKPRTAMESALAQGSRRRRWLSPAIIRTLQDSKVSLGKIVDGIFQHRKSDDLILRSATFGALGRLAAAHPDLHAKVVPYLIEALSDADDGTRGDAAATLGRINAKQAVKKLYDLREDPSGKVAVWSAWAIWKVTGAREQAEAAMITRLRGDKFGGKWEAVYLLSEFEEPAKETIAALVELTKYDGKAPFTGDEYERNRLKNQAKRTLKAIAPNALPNE